MYCRGGLSIMRRLLDRVRAARDNERGLSGIIELIVTMAVLGIVMPMVAIGAYSITNSSSALIGQNTAFSLQSNATLNAVQDISSAQPAPYCSNAPGSATSAAFLYATTSANCPTPAQGFPVLSSPSDGYPTAPCIGSCSPVLPTPNGSGTACNPSNGLPLAESQSALVVATTQCIGFFSYASEGAVSVPMVLSSRLSANSYYSQISVTSAPVDIPAGTNLTLQSGATRVVVKTTQDTPPSAGTTIINIGIYIYSTAFAAGTTVSAASQSNPTLTPPNLQYFWTDSSGSIWLTTFASTTSVSGSTLPEAWTTATGSSPSCQIMDGTNGTSTSPSAYYTNPCWSAGASSSRLLGALAPGAKPDILTYSDTSGNPVTPYTGNSPACDSTAGTANTCAAALTSIAQATISLTFANKSHQAPSQSVNIPIKGNVLSQI